MEVNGELSQRAMTSAEREQFITFYKRLGFKLVLLPQYSHLSYNLYIKT